MEKFTAFDPKAEVIGRVILSVTQCVKRDDILPILKAHGLEDVKPDKWYPQQVWLDVFKDVAQGDMSSIFNLVAIGLKIAENSILPPEVNSIEAVLLSMDADFKRNHRGDAGGFTATIVGERHIQVVERSPYPDDCTYGVIYGFARRFCPPGGQFTVRHDDTAPCRKNGADSCTYHVTWEAS